MEKLSIAFKNIALVKEIESPENPSGLEKRVALTPEDVGQLTAVGVKVFVEYGAGLGVDFEDEEYLKNGAVMQKADEIYKDKDMIIKFKGPSLESISKMKKGCTLFCMAHFHSFPDRAKMLEDSQINVIAMEEILESPKVQTDEQILARTGMTEALKSFIDNETIGNLKIFVIGRNERLAGAVKRAGNRNPHSLNLLHKDVKFEELKETGSETLYFYDSEDFNDSNGLIEKLKETNSNIFDLHEFELKSGDVAIADYRKTHTPSEFGLRRIQCLHETGQAGARYGIKLLKENKPDLDIREAKVVVLGYGNVARGAMHEIYNQGFKNINILGRTQTAKDKIDFWLKDVDLVVNGAELPRELRGITYLVSNDHLKRVIPKGSVVIDLVGGSETNRSAVESVLSCTFLTEPHFIKEEVTVSALWGWPMLGMMRESAIKYSSQITDVLIRREKLIEGLDTLTAGVKRALVCGPFK
ncbi:MAG: alanine dehydrogenase [Candidatus Stahlbacteria bacterium]|nr:MAG: alanine dehydrogenase [Candidatus Stahlbacteria bacterium]